MTRFRLDATRDPAGQLIYLRDVRSGAVWGPTHHPARGEPSDYLVTFQPEKAIFRRREDEIATQLEIAVSTEDDVEVRRLTVTNQSDRHARDRGDELRRDRPRPAGGRSRPSRVRQALHRDRVPPRRRRAPPAATVARPPTSPRSGRCTCSATRGGRWVRWSGRAIAPAFWVAAATCRILRRSTAGRSRAPPARCSTRQRALCQRLRLPPGGLVRLAFTTGVAESRDAAIALAHKYHDAGAVARTFALAFAHGQSGRRHLGISSDEAVLFERLASRVLYTDASLRAAPELTDQNTLGQEGLWPYSISGDLPILAGPRGGRGRPPAGASGAPGSGVLATQGPRRRRRRGQRESPRLFRRDAGLARGAVRRGPVAVVATSARRPVPAARRAAVAGRAHAPPERGPRRPRRRSRRARPPARSVLSRARRTGAAAAACRGGRGHDRRRCAGRRLASRAARPHAREPPGRLHHRRARVRDPPRRRRRDAVAVGERHRQSELRYRRHRFRLRLHLVRQQPREPAHTSCRRPGERPHQRGDLRPRRRERLGLDADTGADAASPRRRPLCHSPRRRDHALRARVARPRPPARGLRRRRGSGQALAPHADQREWPPAATERLLLLRMGAGTAARRTSACTW